MSVCWWGIWYICRVWLAPSYAAKVTFFLRIANVCNYTFCFFLLQTYVYITKRQACVNTFRLLRIINCQASRLLTDLAFVFWMLCRATFFMVLLSEVSTYVHCLLQRLVARICADLFTISPKRTTVFADVETDIWIRTVRYSSIDFDLSCFVKKTFLAVCLFLFHVAVNFKCEWIFK